METSHDEQPKKSSTADKIRSLEETVAYLQRDIETLTRISGEIVSNLQNVMTEVAKTKKRIDLWPFVKVPAK